MGVGTLLPEPQPYLKVQAGAWSSGSGLTTPGVTFKNTGASQDIEKRVMSRGQNDKAAHVVKKVVLN